MRVNEQLRHLAVIASILVACDAAPPEDTAEETAELDEGSGGESLPSEEPTEMADEVAPAAPTSTPTADPAPELGDAPIEVSPPVETDEEAPAEAPVDRMLMGINFSYLAPSWQPEQTWTSEIPENPWSAGFNPWNEAFLQDIAMYDVLRPMQWNAVNPLKDNGSAPMVDWSQRRLPDDPGNFLDIGTTQGPGLAFEWQIDLANRLGSDLWLTVPVEVNDAFFEELAKLVKAELDPDLNVYVELANEFWNYKREQNYAAQAGLALGLQPRTPDGNEYEVAILWQAHRSAILWSAFERVWGEESDRVVNVISGKSTNPWLTKNLHLGPLLDEEGFNPTGSVPEAYAIAPYFGGNGLPGDAEDVFDLLHTDLFEHRWNNPDEPSRLQNVRDQYRIVTEEYGLPLLAYEGGQHIEGGAFAPNHDERMYDIYREYLDAIEPYFVLFNHFSNTAQNGDVRSFGSKDYTGQPDEECPKYRALRDYIGSAL